MAAVASWSCLACAAVCGACTTRGPAARTVARMARRSAATLATTWSGGTMAPRARRSTGATSTATLSRALPPHASVWQPQRVEASYAPSRGMVSWKDSGKPSLSRRRRKRRRTRPGGAWPSTAQRGAPEYPRLPESFSGAQPPRGRIAGSDAAWPVRRHDEYAWMNDDANEATVAQFAAHETEYAEAVMDTLELKALHSRLVAEEIARRAPGADAAPEAIPEAARGFEYYMRFPAGKDMPVYCRRPLTERGTVDASGSRGAAPTHRAQPAQVVGDGDGSDALLDMNALLEDFEFVMLGQMRLSPGHRYLAYTVDTEGRERYTCFIRDLATGTVLPDALSNVVGVAFGNPCRIGMYDAATYATPHGDEDSVDASPPVLYYTTADSLGRAHKVHRHVVGTPAADDEELFEEPDSRFFVDVMSTKDNHIVTINVNDKDTSEVHLIDAHVPGLSAGTRTPPPRPRLMHARVAGERYFVEHHATSERLFIVTNVGGATNYKVVTTPSSEPSRENWRDLVPASEEQVHIEDLDMFDSHIVLFEKDKRTPRLRVLQIDSEGGAHIDDAHVVPLPGDVVELTPGANHDYGVSCVRFSASYVTRPHQVFDYDASTLSLQLRHQREVPPPPPSSYPHLARPFVAADYTWAEEVAVSADGTEVPVTVVARTDVASVRDGSHPMLLNVYGAYGISLDPSFMAHRLSLLDRGWVIAFAHVRGGGELGRDWYEAGRVMRKPNTFADFSAAARRLHELGYSRPSLSVAKGGSAGGLVVGHAANEDPCLFKALVMMYPFLDVVTAMEDDALPLTRPEYAEWGNPLTDPQALRCMLSYSPYDNIRDDTAAYPHMFLRAGVLDVRVQPWHPLKFAARVRAGVGRGSYTAEEGPCWGSGASVHSGPLVLVMAHAESGHFGSTGNKGRLDERAAEYAFLINALGLPLR